VYHICVTLIPTRCVFHDVSGKHTIKKSKMKIFVYNTSLFEQHCLDIGFKNASIGLHAQA